MPSTAERILAILREAAGTVSGAEIARRLDLSRTAVWKHIHKLVGEGYAIGHDRSGYRLDAAPDRLLPAEIEACLRSGRIGRTVHHFDEIDSTNLHAMKLARDGAPEGTVVVAEAQTRGRGRLGRSFFSPRGLSLYASIILRPGVPPFRAPQITLVAGLAVAEAIERHSGIRPGLKWPNDVHLEGRKVAGILTELEAEADRVLHVVCGPGVNLNVPEEAFPVELRPIATSILAATGRRVDRAAFAADLFASLERHYDAFLRSGFAVLRERWESYSVLRERDVVVDGAGGRVEGTAIGIDAEGALRVRTPAGEVRRVVSGDVTLRRARAGL